MTEDIYQFDGTVCVEEMVSVHRYVPQKIYEINKALYCMSDEELLKIMKYITRITDKRCTFRSLAKKMSNKRLFQAMAKQDKKLNRR